MTFTVNYWGEMREFIDFFFQPLFTKNVSALIYCKIVPIIPKDTEILLFTVVIFYGSFDL